MSTVAPPPVSSPSPPEPPRRGGDGGGGGGGRGGGGASPVVRGLAVGALVLVLAIVGYLVFHRGTTYTYHLLFTDAGQLVKGDQVQVGGVPTGSITSITLTTNNLAEVTITVSSPIAPLHQGTTAQIRSPSLSGEANRFVSLSPGPNNAPTLPNGATLGTSSTTGIVDLDAVFDTLDPRTRRALQQVIQGSATQYDGVARENNEALQYFAPALSSADHLLAQLDSDQALFTNFIVATAKTVTAIAARAPQLSSLVQNAGTAFAAIGSQSQALTAGLRQLPGTLQAGNKTFADLTPTLAALTQLVNVSKPDTKTLAPFLRALTPLLNESVGPVTNLALATSRPGPNNDLTDVALDLPALQQVLSHAVPDSIAASQASLPVVSFFRPYAPDFVGALRGAGQSAGYYDASGHYARTSVVYANFGESGTNTLTPVNPIEGLAGLQTGQTRRCPGAAAQAPADGSAPYTEGGTLACNPSEVPQG